MRHGRKVPKLGRTAAHRDAMLSNLAASLIMHHRIVTTRQKARAVAPIVDRLIQTAKNGDTLSARRLVASRLYSPEAVKKLFEETAKKLSDREGGYTRIYHLGRRMGDGAETAVVSIGLEPVRLGKKEKKEEKKKGERPAGYDRVADKEIFKEKAAAKEKPQAEASAP